MRQHPTEEEADRIYTVLVEICGAYDDRWTRGSFVMHVQRPTFTEWRFGGKLGFGGKFWINAGKWYVNYYQEDETPEMVQIVKEANARLASILEDKILPNPTE